MSGPVGADVRGVVVLDLDGVLADARHREHHLLGCPKDWAAFFAAMGDDAPLARGLDLARDVARTHEVVYLTGRPEAHRLTTETWLRAQDAPAGRLTMRPDDDRRRAATWKSAVLRSLADADGVALVVDDDPAVVEAAGSLGLRTLLATWASDPA